MRLFFQLLLLTALSNCFAQNVNNTFRDAIYYDGKTCANVWGYVDSLGNEYALVGVSDGMRIVNVTNPDSIWEVKHISGPNNLWKEIRTYKHYAYCVSEGGQGVQITNLRNLPDTNLSYHHWEPIINGNQLSLIHALHIDTATGYLYLYGCHAGFTGNMIAKLTNPDTPTYRGNYNASYIHDGIVRNNMMYASVMYAGFVRFIDVSVDSLPHALNGVQTPGAFTHNTWLSDDGKYLFATDEVNNSFLTCYNIEDLQNVELTDKIQSNPGSNSVVHNTYYKDAYCFTSWYKDGYTIVDASRPHNLIQVGNYDTFHGSGPSTDGAWGVYPYLPSGNILITSIDTADNTTVGSLVVVTPTLQRACYFEGTVKDSVTSFPISNVLIRFGMNSDTLTEYSMLDGSFATGTVHSGTYTATFSRTGYFSKTIHNIPFQNGVLQSFQVRLVPLDAGIHSNEENRQTLFYVNDRNIVFTHLPSNLKHMSLLDATGRSIQELQAVDIPNSLSVNDYTSGVYFIRFTTVDGKVQTQKLILH